MTKEQRMVLEFHQKFSLTVETKPTLPTLDDLKLRCSVVHEEEREFFRAQNLVEAADALGDLLYVVLGTAVTYGIDLEPIVAEIHESNMSKLWTDEERNGYALTDLTFKETAPDGNRRWVARNAIGKVIKSPSYVRADIAKQLRLQGYVE